MRAKTDFCVPWSQVPTSYVFFSLFEIFDELKVEYEEGRSFFSNRTTARLAYIVKVTYSSSRYVTFGGSCIITVFLSSTD